ncbi:hypothetical protein [Helicobacter sp.]|uniref:hypothetical protein n=1 Tax=Helicobacter sp. TaxID=218 RepID=UPI0025C1C9D4|nr:hypothetical protein [Helicobacter sp.]MCI5968294.1 hypothetical protein [Helicobacter sp.]MDY2585386.1 hypothetical protein [Helicobacter sp.]
MIKRAIVLGGSYFHQALLARTEFAHLFSEVIYLPKLHSYDLKNYDCVFLSSRLNPKFLRLNAQKLLDYLEEGGNIAILGGVEEEYLPHIVYKEGEVNFWWWIHEGADLPLFAFNANHTFWNFLSIEECKWHYHGTFKVEEGCQRILINEIGENILYKDDLHFKGRLYLSALDPDFHIGQGFMPITLPFFEKYIQWIEYDILKG